MSFYVVGIGSKSAPLDVRERVARSIMDRRRVLAFLTLSGVAESAVVVSTCERVEIYAEAQHISVLSGHLSKIWGADDLERFFYILEGREAVRHLFCVASGIDSSVIGESEIVGQLKEAYHFAIKAGTLRGTLMRVFERAFFVSSCVRNSQRDTLNKTSLAGIAVERAFKEYGQEERAKVFVLGAGVLARSIVEHLHDRGVEHIIVANRTYERACMIAEQTGARAMQFKEFYKSLAEADIVIGATASPHPMVRVEHVVDIRRKVLFIDLAVPRDISPEVGSLPEKRVLTLEDVAPEQCRCYDVFLSRAEEIVDEKLDRFWTKSGLVEGMACLCK